MADDPYATLGVPRTASDAEIKKAYRKLAKDLHPDLNPGDASAVDRFKKVSAAYDLLRDPEQRASFDRGEIDASGAERQEQRFYRDFADTAGGRRYHSSAGFEDFADVSDIFGDFFGRQAGTAAEGLRFRGGDLRYQMEIDFLDAVNGAERRITLPDGGSLDLSIPAGVRDGATLRLRGKGTPGIGGGGPGDALIDIVVRPHSVFQRDGDDIVVEAPITIDEAVLGGKIEVPTIAGAVRMNVPERSSSGDTLRLRGRGVKSKGRKAGDQRVILKIVAPEEPDPELEAALRAWRDRRKDDPRHDLRRAS